MFIHVFPWIYREINNILVSFKKFYLMKKRVYPCTTTNNPFLCVINMISFIKSNYRYHVRIYQISVHGHNSETPA